MPRPSPAGGLTFACHRLPAWEERAAEAWVVGITLPTAARRWHAEGGAMRRTRVTGESERGGSGEVGGTRRGTEWEGARRGSKV